MLQREDMPLFLLLLVLLCHDSLELRLMEV